MSAQHAPHTPPLWRKVLSLPHTRLGWWAVGLAAPALVLTVYSETNWALGGDPNQPGLLLLTWLLSAVLGGVVGLIAVGARDRTWLVWVAQVPGVLFFAFLVWGISSISLGHDANPWVTFPIAVLLWAVMVFNILWSTRKSGES